MSEVLDSMWNEKYRPKTLDELSLPERYNQDFRRIIEKGSLPNLLFSGPPGGGKTTLALILCSKNGVLFNKNDNLLMANGSSKKGRSINFVDQVVEPFLKHPPAGDKYKVVFMDEADNITPDAYDSWRGIIEKYHKEYGRFIWTGNYISKIPGPVQSRFTPYVFQQIPKEQVLEYCKSILKSEQIDHVDKDVNFIINQLYPDVRRIVNILQRCSWEGKLVVDRDAIITNERVLISNVVEIVSLIEKSEDNKIGPVINKMVEILASQDVEFRNIYTELFFMKKIPAPVKITVNKYSNSHQGCLIPHMHFMAMVFEIIKVLQDYRKVVAGK
jgi:replication factor C small subunit